LPNRNYNRGAALERQWCRDKAEQGYVVGRIAGSHGLFDAFAACPGELILAQMKSGGANKYDGFGPSARAELALAATRAGGRAVLVRKYSRQRGYTEIPQAEWPNSQEV
jgi:Holliday junction resolvase